MKKIKKAACRLGIVLGLLSLSVPSFAGDGSVLNVNAHVLARLSHSLVQQQSSLKVSQADIAKGYIDIPAGTVMKVSTNAQQGYFLHVGMMDFVREVTVTVNGRTVEVPTGGGLFRQPASGLKQDTLQIGYRLFIAPGIVPGTYAWPVSIAASLI